MNIKICDKCKGFNHKEVIKKINELGINVEYEIGCNSMCGVGRNNIVLIVDNKPIISKNILEVLEKLKDLNDKG